MSVVDEGLLVLLPQVVGEHLRPERLPGEGVAHRLGEVVRGGLPFGHHLPEVVRVEQRRARLDHRRLAQLLNPGASAVAQIVEEGVGLLPVDGFDRETQPAHELIDVVQRERPGGARRSGVDDRIGVGQRGAEGSRNMFIPVVFGVDRTHILEVAVGEFGALVPATGILHLFADAGAEAVVDPAEDTGVGQLLRPFRRKSFGDHALFGIAGVGPHEIRRRFGFGGAGGHAHRPVDQDHPAGGDAPELPGGLNRDIDPRAAELLRRNQPHGTDPAAAVPHRLHPQQEEDFAERRPLGPDELPAPERKGDFARIVPGCPEPALDQRLAEAAADGEGLPGRGPLRIDSVEVAPGGHGVGIQHRTSARPRCDEAAAKGVDERIQLRAGREGECVARREGVRRLPPPRVPLRQRGGNPGAGGGEVVFVVEPLVFPLLFRNVPRREIGFEIPGGEIVHRHQQRGLVELLR